MNKISESARLMNGNIIVKPINERLSEFIHLVSDIDNTSIGQVLHTCVENPKYQIGDVVLFKNYIGEQYVYGTTSSLMMHQDDIIIKIRDESGNDN